MDTKIEGYRYARIHVAYFERDVPAVVVGRGVYFPLRALCESIGLQPHGQRAHLKDDSRYADALRMLPIPTVKGLRDALCIRKHDVTRWLANVDPAKCALKAREALDRFQAELFAAADRLLWGDTSVSVYDPATKTTAPISGRLNVGQCPGCGMALCLTFDDGPAHLIPAPEE